MEVTTSLLAGVLLVSLPIETVGKCNQTSIRHTPAPPVPNLPDANLTAPQLIQKNGYPVENHTVKTSDKYLLTLHRIPYGKSCPDACNKTVLLLHHGLFGSSADWVVSGPKHALAYFLADRGYDVWLGNSRGNLYSNRHATLNASDIKYWNFSWEEMGKLDLSAMIDHILNVTGQKCLYYVGHSMGSALFFILMSSHPKYNNKICASFQLAPAFYFLNNSDFSVVKNISAIGKLLLKEPLKDSFQRQDCLKFCAIPAAVCNQLRFLIGGFSISQIDKDALSSIISHSFAGTSTKAFSHYAKAVLGGVLLQYEYSPVANLGLHGSLLPREYNLTLVTSPMHIYYSKIDPVVGVCEVEHLVGMLPKVRNVTEVSEFTHLDFLWSINARGQVYADIISRLDKAGGNKPVEKLLACTLSAILTELQ